MRLAARSRPKASRPAATSPRKRAWGDMSTGGSRGIRSSQDYVRRGGAAARMMLLQAAADRMEGAGRRTHRRRRASSRTPSSAADQLRQGRRGRGEAHAARSEERSSSRIRRDWKIAGKPLKRLDTADKLNGSKVYAIDLKLPGMLNAAIKDCPVFGGKLKSYDEAKIARHARRARRSCRSKDTAVAVVADTWWQAKTALDALPIVWDEGAQRQRCRARRIAEHLEGRPDRDRDQRRPQATAMRWRRSPARRRRSRRSTRRRSCRTPAWR